MVKVDYTFSEILIHSLIGKTFIKYKCHNISNNNAVHEIVGMLIGDNAYALKTFLESIYYLNSPDDAYFMKLCREKESDIKSEAIGTILTDTPVNSVIKSITLVNEHQLLIKDRIPEYEAFITRAMIFKFESGFEIKFEKDNWLYSDLIKIGKGYNLETELSDVNEFCTDWSDFGVNATCYRTTVVYK